jgi:cobalt/nickel transport system permease protein
LHHAVPDRWSRGNSSIHRRDARAKIIPLIVLLIVIARSGRDLPLLAVEIAIWLGLGLLWARVPVGQVLWRSSWILPFTFTFAAVTWLAGDSTRAVALVLKSYLSALGVMFVVATTPLPDLLKGFERLGAPRFLLEVGQFLYRYLFVISTTARNMSKAAGARGGSGRGWVRQRRRFHAMAGSLAVLFAKSYARAEEIYRAMRARGFDGRLPVFALQRFQYTDAAFTLVASMAPVALRLAAESLVR